MKKIFIFIISIILCLTGCGNSIKETENIENNQLTMKERLAQYIFENFGHTEETLIVEAIINGDDNQDFLVSTPGMAGAKDTIFYVKFNGEEITEYKGIEDKVPEFKKVEISQGTFLQVTHCDNQGNGEIILWDQEKGEIAYEFSEDTFDQNYENQAGLSEIIFSGGLGSNYADLNNDGYEDAMFFGKKGLVYGKNKNYKMKNEYVVKDKYIYDVEKDEFVYSKELSEERKIEN